jgi:hypothetical protein
MGAWALGAWALTPFAGSAETQAAAWRHFEGGANTVGNLEGSEEGDDE